MKIAVCVKAVPDAAAGRRIDPSTKRLDRSAELAISDWDTYPVEEIPRLVALIERGADLVNASRLSKRPNAMPLANYIANRVFAWTARLLHGIKTTDVHSGMRAYRKGMIDAVQWDPNGPALPVDMLVLPYRLGYRVVEVPIEYRERIGASTLQRFRSTLWTFKRLWRARKIGR